MVKTKYEKELEEQSHAMLVYMCEGKGLLHTGDKDALIARLVEWEKAQLKEPEPEPEPPPPEEPPVEKSQSPSSRARHTAR